MPCGWEGNRRSGVALAMRHRLQWSIHLEAHCLDREMSTPPTLSCAVWPIYLYVYVSKWQYHIPEDASESSWCGISWHGVNKWNVGRLNTTQTTSQQLCCQPPRVRVRVRVNTRLTLTTVLSASYSCCKCDTDRIWPLWRPTAAATDRYLLPAGHPAANPPHTAAAVDRQDRQTDGRTPDRYIDPAPHCMTIVSKWS